MKYKKTFIKLGIALCILTNITFGVESAEAARISNSSVVKMGQRAAAEKKVAATKDKAAATEDKAVTTEERPSITERIQAILHPEKNKKNNTTVTKADSKEKIMGFPQATQEQCVKYLLKENPNPKISVSPKQLVAYYYEEGEREGVRPDVAFVQALKETGFFRYGGTVTPDQNNYCGLGTTSATVKGAYFSTAQMGVRAHIQHLMAYATTTRPSKPLVDPRYNTVRSKYGIGTITSWVGLNGKWAVPGTHYGESILNMFQRVLKQ